MLASLAGLLAATSWTGSAAAQSYDLIFFDFTAASAITLLGGTIVTPPDGTLTVGKGRVIVESTALGVLVPGGEFLFENFRLGGTVSKNVAGVANVAGPYAAQQVGTLTGTLAPGGDGGEFSDDLALDMNVQIGCSGSGCAALGMPIDDVGVSLLPLSFLPVTGLDTPGGAEIHVTVPIEIDGVLGTLDLVGLESARVLIPEPGTFALLALGLGVLGFGRRHKK